MTVRRHEFVPVLLDCGCSTTPTRGDNLPIATGATLVTCEGHGIRHSVQVAEEVVTISYTSKRLDPADPEPEPVEVTV